MALDVKIHDTQTIILRELLFVKSAGFAELQKQTKLTSDHFNFHIARLVELGLVEKGSQGYCLTAAGKEYANKLDTDEKTIERQPKVAVLLLVKSGDLYLIQQRLKHPYFGFWGYPTGKVRWGETLSETATRELKEETGLEAEFSYHGLYHKMDYNKRTGELLEDKMFHVMLCEDPRGEVLAEFEGGRNEWLTREQAIEKFAVSFGVEQTLHIIDAKAGFFTEQKNHYEPQQY